MLAIPDHISMQCPRCLDDISLEVDVTTIQGGARGRVLARVADFAGPLEQHYRDAGHVDVEDNVTVRVHTLHLN